MILHCATLALRYLGVTYGLLTVTYCGLCILLSGKRPDSPFL